MNKHFLLSRCFCSLVIILFFCIDFAANVTICWFSLKLVCCSLNFLLLLSFSQEFLADNSLFGGTTSLLCLFVLEWTLFLIQTHPRLWAFTCSCMFSLLSPLPAAAPFLLYLHLKVLQSVSFNLPSFSVSGTGTLGSPQLLQFLILNWLFPPSSQISPTMKAAVQIWPLRMTAVTLYPAQISTFLKIQDL